MDSNAEERYQQVARGFRVVAAIVVIGLILAAGEGAITEPMPRTAHEVAAASASAVPSSDYFPSGYTLQATEPEPPIEQF